MTARTFMLMEDSQTTANVEDVVVLCRPFVGSASQRSPFITLGKKSEFHVPAQEFTGLDHVGPIGRFGRQAIQDIGRLFSAAKHNYRLSHNFV